MKQIYSQISGLIGIIIFTGMGFLLYVGTILGPSVPYGTSFIDDPRLTMICFGTGSIAVAWIFGSTMINSIPTVWLDESGITVSTFLFFRKHIPWHDVLDVSPIRTSSNYVLVRARNITLFHRMIGWIYSHTLYPGFLIASYINDHEELILRIRRSIPSA